MGDVACLVACSASKRDERTVAWQLYDSTLFQKSWTAATVLGQPYVVSAKHGLVPPHRRLDPYDETLKTKGEAECTEWAENVLKVLPTDYYEHVVVFGGRDYVEPLRRVHEGPFATNTDHVTFHDPYADTGGNGEQMSLADDLYYATLEGGEVPDVLP